MFADIFGHSCEFYFWAFILVCGGLTWVIGKTVKDVASSPAGEAFGRGFLYGLFSQLRR